MTYQQNFLLNKIPSSLIFLLFLIFLVNCSEEKDIENSRIIIGVQSDVQTINPMYAFSLVEGNLIDLLFMKPAMEVWNDSLGTIEFNPMLAEKWEWSNDNKTITLYLRDDIYWSDSTPITVDDIIFSFDAYSDPKVESRFFGQFEKFYTIDGQQINIDKTFNKISPTVVEINFKEDSFPDLLDINLELIPKHVWSKFKREDFPQLQVNFEPITSGPFRLIKWEREAIILLRVDSLSFLYKPENISEIIFKVLPDYTARINHLKTGEIDILDNIKSEDTEELKGIEKLNITSLRGRDYDYIGWNHISSDELEKSKLIPNKYFSSPEIRKALTIAINREEIVQSYLAGYGELCKGPVSPMFKNYYDYQLPTNEYNPSKAKEILKKNGWEDKNGNGIIEKGDVEFRFDLYTNTGNPRRSYVATIVKNNLKAIGIDANINVLETSSFVQGLMARNYDAWLAGWTIPVPIDLNPYWNSDPEIGFLNFSSYKNEEKDNILMKLKQKLTESEKKELYKKLQSIFYEDEPVTFLYWFDNIVAYNNRITNIKFSMLGMVKNAWEWSIN